jgi:hypothetical protein
MRPPSKPRYLPERQVLRSAALDLELVGEPLVPAAAHALPIEYQEGPYRWVGSMGGRPVTGVSLSEATNAMYRDWELLQVLETQLALDAADSPALAAALEDTRARIARRDNEATLSQLDRLRPLLADRPDGAETLEILDALAHAVRADLR